jgi:Bacterial protein of unknown function (DUF885)
MPSARVLTLWEANMPETREYAGRHEFDGTLQDLSPGGVADILGRIGEGPRAPDRHDEAHLVAMEAGVRAQFEVVEQHRWNPIVHLMNLDLACYDREYAPAADRHRARIEHLAGWPGAVAGAIDSLDRVPAPVSDTLLPSARGLAAGLDELARAAGQDGRASESGLDEQKIIDDARAAHARLVDHLESAAGNGPPEVALGAPALTSLLGAPEGLPVDLGRLERAADAERGRLRARLQEDCERYRPGSNPAELLAELHRDHPDADGIYAEAKTIIAEATAFTLARDLLPPLGGECLVGPSPESRRDAVAMMSWSAPDEQDAPAWYYVNPPDPAWPPEEQDQWLSMFCATTLPGITVHEVTPGHFAHGQMLGRAVGDVRRTLYSLAFLEGWAHYAEELLVEEGFRKEDPRFAIGVWVEALVRVTRFAVALGIHAGSMTLDEAARRFEEDAFLEGAGARSEARRATFDPTYGRYTWGKLEIRALRDEAEAVWGTRYSHRRFHESLLALGAPPLGTMGDALGDM